VDGFLSVVEVGGQYVTHNRDIPLLMGVTACNDNRLRIVLHIYIDIQNTLRAFRIASIAVMIVNRVASASSLSVTAALENNPSSVITRDNIPAIGV